MRIEPSGCIGDRKHFFAENGEDKIGCNYRVDGRAVDLGRILSRCIHNKGHAIIQDAVIAAGIPPPMIGANNQPHFVPLAGVLEVATQDSHCFVGQAQVLKVTSCA